MKRIIASIFGIPALACFGFALIGAPAAAQEAPKPVEAPVAPQPGPEQPPKRTPKIQLAILLDTSGSMDGLIDQARTQIWKIVNTFSKAKQEGVAPVLEVALYEYGNDGIPATEGHVRQVVGLTTDLDKVSQELFKLTTNGGEEYCGEVIKRTIGGLQWSDHRDDYKAIFIAGNEPFTQGTVDYAESCKAAIAKGVIVNTIHCGDYQEGINSKWQAGALLADGSYMAINANVQVVHIESPVDGEIVKLGEELNTTYIPYGSEAKEAADRQAEQDTNAAKSGGGAAVQRAQAKNSQNYRNDSWDAVDAIDAGTLKFEDIKRDQLPEELRKMTDEELKKYIDDKRTKRAELKKKLSELEAKREAFVAEKRKESAEKGEETLDSAMTKAIEEQAAKRNIQTK